MFKTGNVSVDFFSQVTVFIPLLPVVIILLRGTYRKDILTFLLILCLTNCIGSLLPRISKATNGPQIAIQHLFSFIEFIILTQIFKPEISGRLRKFLDILLIAFISSALTYYLLEGVDQNGVGISRIQDLIIIIISLINLFKLIRNSDLDIFSLPLFWISVGTLFYFVVANIMEAAGCCSVLSISTITDKILLLNIANLIRYFFYALAGICYPPSKNSGSVL
jgi:hypothetical protein